MYSFRPLLSVLCAYKRYAYKKRVNNDKDALLLSFEVLKKRRVENYETQPIGSLLFIPLVKNKIEFPPK